MPFRKTYKKKRPYRKRVYRKRTYKKRSSVTNYIPRGPVPNRTIVKLKYCQQFSMDPGASGIPAYHYYNLGSLYDTDVTGSGHQPLGHDQYALLYKHYTVLGAKATVIFSSQSDVATGALIVGTRMDKDTTTTTDGNLTSLTEQKGSYYKYLGSNKTNAITKVSMKYSMKKFFGNQYLVNRQGIGADFGASPSAGAYLQIFAAPIDASINAAVIKCYINISFIVMLTEPIDLAQS